MLERMNSEVKAEASEDKQCY